MFFLMCFFLSHTAGAEPAPNSAVDFSLMGCLLEEKNVPCSTQKDQLFLQNISLLSPQLVHDFSKLERSLKMAVADQNFEKLEDINVESVPGGMILSLPVCHLSDLNGGILAAFMRMWHRNKVVFKHIVKAFLYSHCTDTFASMLNHLDLHEDTLNWAAEVASFSRREEAVDILGRLPVLFYAPPESIVIHRKQERFFLLSFWDHPDDVQPFRGNKPFLRFWAYTMIKDRFLEPLKNWNTFYIDRWGFFLTGATTDELNKLNSENTDNLPSLFKFNFSPVQVRFLFDKFYSNQVLTTKDFKTLSVSVVHLLPVQLRGFPLEVGKFFEKFEYPTNCGYPSLRQILEIIQANSFINKDSRDIRYVINNFVNILPLATFQRFINHHFNMTSLLRIQETHLSKSQMYYLSLKHNIFNFSSDDIFKCSEYMTVLPARDIILNHTATHVSLHILSKIDSANIPQTFATLNKFWSEIGSASVFSKILKNPQPKEILNNIPTRLFFDSLKDLMPIIKMTDFKNLPPMFVASLKYRLQETSNNFKFLNLNESLSFLMTSINCEDIWLLDPYYFIMFMSKYNHYIKLSGQTIPKNVQQCCIQKLLEVLEMKSLLSLDSPYFSKLSLLNDAEVDGIGGNILCALPSLSISRSRNARAIIKSIGRLAPREMISSVSINHLQKLSSILVQALGPAEKISFPLFDLGNLTLFLEEKYIERIDEEFFMLFLESDYIDHRLCVNHSIRAAWYNFIKQTFGEPENWTYQTLTTLGDFLIVVPIDDLYKIKDEAWIYSADTFNTRYLDKEFNSNLKFYEVCLLRLNKNEKLLYIKDLKNLITTLVRAAQLQIDTIVSAETLIGRNKYRDGEIFNFVEFNEGIHFSFPTQKTITNEEPTPTSASVIKTLFQEVSSSEPSSTEFPTSYKFNTTPELNSTPDLQTTLKLPNHSDFTSSDTNFTKEFPNNSELNTSPILPSAINISTINYLKPDELVTKLEFSTTPKFIYKSGLTSTQHMSSKFIEPQDLTTHSVLTSDRDSYSTEYTRPHTTVFESSAANKNYSVEFMKHSEISSGEVFPSKKNSNTEMESNITYNKSNNSSEALTPLIETQADLKSNLSYPFMRPMVKPAKEIRKRSTNEKWTCEALKMVGKATELVLSESIVSSLSNEDLLNCLDFLAELDLNTHIKSLIWERINLENFVSAGKLVSSCKLSDVLNKNFSLASQWSLEYIYLLGKYNSRPEVRYHVANEAWRLNNKPLRLELVVSLGSLICELPDISPKIIEPSVMMKSSAVLGESLSCNYTCLSKLSAIAVHKDAFNDPTTWTFSDVHDLGIIVSGLNVSGWELLIQNHDALSGLSEAAFNCLPYNYIKMMKKIPIDILPLAISNRFTLRNTEEKLLHFDFYNKMNPSKPESHAVPLFSFNKYILTICLLFCILSA